MTATSLTRPPAPAQLRNFPRRELQPTDKLFRTHKAQYGAWYFSNGMLGRFDLAAPMGTCYVAEQQIGAFMEQFRGFTFLKQAVVNDMRMSVVSVPYAIALADCTSSLARGFGITANFHSTSRRPLTQEWADAFLQAGFHGVRYFLRNDPASKRIGVALFGSAGVASWYVGSTHRIDARLIGNAKRIYGVKVVP